LSQGVFLVPTLQRGNAYHDAEAESGNDKLIITNTRRWSVSIRIPFDAVGNEKNNYARCIGRETSRTNILIVFIP
jgi:hypothetical protein